MIAAQVFSFKERVVSKKMKEIYFQNWKVQSIMQDSVAITSGMSEETVGSEQGEERPEFQGVRTGPKCPPHQ